MTKQEPDRAARLAEALRANLRRRKAQARDHGSDARDTSPAGDDPAFSEPLDGEAGPPTTS